MPNMSARKFVELSKRLSVDYVSEVQRDDISLAREIYETFPTLYSLARVTAWNRDGISLFQCIKLTTEDFPTVNQREPVLVNGLVLLMFITSDERLKRITSMYLRNAKIQQTTALLDRHFPDIK